MVTSESEHRPLSVLISGAGIGGLAAAAALRQAGHLVQVGENRGILSDQFVLNLNTATMAGIRALKLQERVRGCRQHLSQRQWHSA